MNGREAETFSLQFFTLFGLGGLCVAAKMLLCLLQNLHDDLQIFCRQNIPYILKTSRKPEVEFAKRRCNNNFLSWLKIN